MREMELVTLACGLGSFPYIVFSPVAFPDPDFCSREPDVALDLLVGESIAVPEPIAVAEPVDNRPEPVLARALPPTPSAADIEAPAPVRRPVTSLALVAEVLEVLQEPEPEPERPAAPFRILSELHGAIGRTPRRSPRCEPRGAPKPAAKVALAKAKPN